jgi:hypothetical protein
MVKKILLLCLTILIILGIARTTLKRTASFGCFDDCFNYTAGYLLTTGRELYTTIFYNHAPIPAYLSAFILTLTKPINIYDLLFQHRTFLVMFTLIWTCILIFRFGTKSALVLIGYECMKWYFFGNRFLAEAMIVYPIAYLFFLFMEKKKDIKLVESIWIGFLAWLVVFSREPYIPLVLFLLISIAWKHTHIQAIIVFLTLSLLTLPFFNIQEFYFNLVSVNTATVLADSSKNTPFFQRMLETLLYPLFLLLYQKERVWQSIQLIFLIIGTLSLYSFIRKKAFGITIWFIVLLALSNIRATPIGTVFYSSFQLLPWFMLSICIAAYLITHIWHHSRLTSVLTSILFFSALFWTTATPSSFLYEKISAHDELITNFSEEIQIGNIMHHLQTKDSDIFIDGWAELIYWQAQQKTQYRFGWYTSVMPMIDRYRTERFNYLTTTPPELYYGTCPQSTLKERTLPTEIVHLYTNIRIAGKPSCLWIKTDILPFIRQDQWEKAKEFLVEQPLLVQYNNEDYPFGNISD